MIGELWPRLQLMPSSCEFSHQCQEAQSAARVEVEPGRFDPSENLVRPERRQLGLRLTQPDS